MKISSVHIRCFFRARIIIILFGMLSFSISVFGETSTSGNVNPATDSLSTRFDSGEYFDSCLVRLFSDDDYGLLGLCNFLGNEYNIKLSDPYQLLPEGKMGLFIGIVEPEQKITFSKEELESFALNGNIAIILTSNDCSNVFLESIGIRFSGKQKSKDMPRPMQVISGEWRALNNENTVFVKRVENDGMIIIIGDSFAFCQKRFNAGNYDILKRLLSSYPHKIQAARIIQRKRYIRNDGRAIYSSHNKKIPIQQERDPAFAPSMSDSNDKNTYMMTQQEFFSMEKYCELPSKENSEYHNMMRVRVYDTFVAPDKSNDTSWHFSITSPEEKRLKPNPNFNARGYKLMQVSTLFKPGVPENKALIASISPNSRIVNICVRRVGLIDPRETELEARVSKHRAEVKNMEDDIQAGFGIFQLPGGNKEQKDDLEQKRRILEDEEAELQKVKALNGRPDIERLEDEIPNVKITIYADGLDNYRVKSSPSINELEGCAFVYTIAYRTDYLRNDTREFKRDLIPQNMTISEWRRLNKKAGIRPCIVPNEREALLRLGKGIRYPWVVKSVKVSQAGEKYLPDIVIDALNGKDVSVKQLLDAITKDFTSFKDAPILLKDEFNTFTESMIYWRSGVCRHRARTGFMLLNNLGIPARLVVSRSHAFVEIFVPSGKDSGFWTQVNFGGGFGDDSNELFPEVTLPVLPASSGSTEPDGSFLGGILIGLLCLGIMAYGMILFIRNHAKAQVADRIPMSSVTDFMLSQSEILDYDLKRGEYRGALLAVLEVVIPRLTNDNQKRFMKIYDDVMNRKTVSKEDYSAITRELWKCEGGNFSKSGGRY